MMKPVIMTLQKATIAKRPSSRKPICLMMILYVLKAQMNANEQTNDEIIHNPNGFKAKRLLTVIMLTRAMARTEANNETNMSKQNTSLVLRYLRWYLFNILVIRLIYDLLTVY